MKPLAIFLFIACSFLTGCQEKTIDGGALEGLTITTNYIGKFALYTSRLPDHDEFSSWLNTNLNNLGGVCDYKVSTNDSNQYFIYIWLGERMVKYSSKDREVLGCNGIE